MEAGGRLKYLQVLAINGAILSKFMMHFMKIYFSDVDAKVPSTNEREFIKLLYDTYIFINII